jgi:hypothetical protein
MRLARERILRGPFCFWRARESSAYVWGEAGRSGAAPLQRDLALSGKRKDKEVAFAGGDDGEGTAVGGDGEVAKGEAVEDGDGLRL